MALQLRARRAAAMSLRAGQHSDSDEGADEQDVEDDEEHTQQVGSGATDAELQEHGGEGVQDRSGEDALDGAVGVACAAGEADDLCDADGEEDERGEGGEELEGSEDASEESVLAGSGECNLTAGCC